MKITRIEVSNFKCFKHIKLDLNNFNVIIGKNASGKSNVINIFKFIRDMIVFGIDDAIALQGGINYLYNSTIRYKEPIKIKFTINTYDNDTFNRMTLISRDNSCMNMLEKYETEIHIKANKQGSGYKIIENKIKLYYARLEVKKGINKKERLKLRDFIKKDTIIQECYEEDGEIIEKFDGTISENEKRKLEFKDEFYISKSMRINGENTLLINCIPAIFFFQIMGGENIKIYDFNPKTLKNASIINRKTALEEDGSNISNVLQKILRNTEEKRKLLLILNKLLSFVTNITVENSFNKSMYFKVEENNENNLPSSLLSDGTVNIIAIIIALYFEKNNDIVIIEEPEKNIHPKLANKLVSLMKDVGHNKQVIITTHNTQLLNSVELKDIIYVYRNKEMFSDIERPQKNKKVEQFIKNQLDVGDIFYDGLFTDKEI